MFHLLSFCGRWDESFLGLESLPQQDGELKAEQKKKTSAAVEARANVRHAKKLEHRWRDGRQLTPNQVSLVTRLRDGTLVEEANRLTEASGHGRLRRTDGTFVDIGGSTGGFTRAVLYDWTPPRFDEDE